MRPRQISLAVLIFSYASVGFAKGLSVEVELGSAWQARNDVRIPNDGGDRFSLKDVIGTEAQGYGRLSFNYDFDDRHGLRLVYAPLKISEVGELGDAVSFADENFNAGPVEALYQFDASRLTYRYTLSERERSRLRVGFTALVRDAEVRLTQDGTTARDTNVGVVPLLHLAGAYNLSDFWSLTFDLDALAAPQGRAFDLGLRAEYALSERWGLMLGYRTLEGGADNDTVYNFAWFNQLFMGVRFR